MAIAPIDIYQPPVNNPLTSILSGGTQIIGQILQQQLQIGRDNANNAMAQERDFLSERARLDSLNQRKGEFDATSARDRERFGRSIYESDRNFLAQQDQFEAQQGRLSANDAFAQEQARASATRAFGAEQRDEQRLNFQIANQNFDNAIQAEGLALRRSESESTLARNESLEAERLRREAERERFATSLNNNLAVADSGVVSQEGASAARAAAQQDYFGLASVDPAFASDRPDILRERVGLAPNARPQTAADLRAEQKFQLDLTDREAKQKIESLKPLVADSKAFAPMKNLKSAEDRAAYELEIALNAGSEEAFVALGQPRATPTQLAARDKNLAESGISQIPANLTEAEIKARREFYRRAVGGTSAAPTRGPLSAQDTIQRLRAGYSPNSGQ